MSLVSWSHIAPQTDIDTALHTLYSVVSLASADAVTLNLILLLLYVTADYGVNLLVVHFNIYDDVVGNRFIHFVVRV